MEGDEQDGNKMLQTSKDSTNLIPSDLIIEILSRLPLKSLVKFQYVSKTWCAIIQSKDFLKSLASMSSTPSSQLLITFRNGELTNEASEKSLFLFTSSQEEEEPSTLVATLEMRMASMDAYYRTKSGFLNGLICLSHKGRFMICNPTTTQVITLPKIPHTKWKSTYRFLGYDPVDDQYKALCKKFSYFTGDQEHMVFTIKGDKKSSWRHIESTTKNYTPFTKGICINGFVYYGASTQTGSRVIVCFDVRSEKLSFIKIDWSGPLNLINYKGKLANVQVNLHTICVWVLQDAKY